MSDQYRVTASNNIKGFSLETQKPKKNEQTTTLRKEKRGDEGIRRRNLTVDSEWVNLNEHFKQEYSLADLESMLDKMLR